MTDREVVQRIEAALAAASIKHMVVGSFASSEHGNPRSTRDLDIVIDPTREQLDVFLEGLAPDQYYVDAEVARDALRRRSMFNVIDISTAWKIDFIIRKSRPFSIEELERRVMSTVVGVEAPIATAEDTIIAKLEWARDGSSQRQLEDVAGILRLRGESIDRSYLERWIAELDLVEMLAAAEKLV